MSNKKRLLSLSSSSSPEASDEEESDVHNFSINENSESELMISEEEGEHSEEDEMHLKNGRPLRRIRRKADSRPAKKRRNIPSEEISESNSEPEPSKVAFGGDEEEEEGADDDGSLDEEDEEDEDEDSFIVDDDEGESDAMDIDEEDDEEGAEFRNLVNTIGTRKSKAELSAFNTKRADTDKQIAQEGVKKSKKLLAIIEDWNEDREMRRSARMGKLREMSKTSSAIEQLLGRSAHERKRLFGSKQLHHPLGLIGTLYFHQMVSVAWCLLRENIPFKQLRGGVLADEMGVGKTTAILAVIACDTINGYDSYLSKEEMRYFPPTLVVCPNSLIVNWKREARERFEPSAMQILILNESYTSGWMNNVTPERIVESDIVIINYESLRSAHSQLVLELQADIMRKPRDYNDLVSRGPLLHEMTQTKLKEVAETLANKHFSYGFKTIWSDSDRWTAIHFLFGYHFRRIVFDECTQFKNDTTKTFHSIMHLQGERIWALSGTPMENGMDELYALMKSLGVAKVARSVSDKARWHHFLKIEKGSGGRAVHTPPPDVIRRLKRRFLNVLQLRREIQNTNTVDPLLNYTLRVNEETSHAWDTFVTARNSAKSERALHRRGNAYIDDVVPEEMADSLPVTFNRPLEVLTKERLDNNGDDSIWPFVTEELGISEGFYWNTRQSEFVTGYKRVNSWLREIFDTSIEQLSQAIQDARQVMIDRNIAMPVTTEDCSAITTAIEAVMNSDQTNKVLRGPISVLAGFPVPKPLLFVARMHSLEEHIYKTIVDAGARLASALTGDGATVNRNATGLSEAEWVETTSIASNAFDIITQSRNCCADYRTPRTALQLIERARHELWDTDPSSIKEAEESLSVSLFSSDTMSNNIDTATAKANSVSLPVVDEIQEVGDEELEKPAFDEFEQADDIEDNGKSTKEASRNDSDTLYDIPLGRLPTKYYMILRYIQSIPVDDKVVIFSDLVRFFPRLKLFLEKHGIKTVYVTGRQKGKQRDDIIESFKHTGPQTPRVLLASLRCLSQGHNLQVANHVIMWNGWWNGSFEEQAKRRVLRPGQKKQVFIVYLALTGTIDELVMSKAGLKESMINAVIGGHDGVITTGANFSRPDATKTHWMEFETNAAGEYMLPQLNPQERSLDALTTLPPDPQFGKTFSHVNESFLFSKSSGRINNVHVAQALVGHTSR